VQVTIFCYCLLHINRECTVICDMIHLILIAFSYVTVCVLFLYFSTFFSLPFLFSLYSSTSSGHSLITHLTTLPFFLLFRSLLLTFFPFFLLLPSLSIFPVFSFFPLPPFSFLFFILLLFFPLLFSSFWRGAARARYIR
jgi:hypothetical protein